MIKLNKQEYANYTTEITWGTFDVYFQGKKEKELLLSLVSI